MNQGRKHRIVVLGAGYAGAYAAGTLARRLSPKDVEITVVNGAPAIGAVVGDRVAGVVAFDILSGTIATIRGIASPTRLARLDAAWTQHDPGSPIIAEW